jgi:hypothetical protein
MNHEEILARTLFAIKERLELLHQDALEAKVQAFPEIAKYDGDDISVEPTTPSTPPTLSHHSDEDEFCCPMSMMSGTSATLIGPLVIATRNWFRFLELCIFI